MKKISYWAKHHVWQSRMLIVMIYIMLSGLGLSTGKLLHQGNINLPQMYFVGCIIFTLALWTWYPTKNSKRKILSASSYIHRKLFDFSLGAVTFLMILYIGNNWKNISISQPVQAFRFTHNPKDSSVSNNSLIKNFIESINAKDVSKLSAKEKMRMIKKQLKTIKNDKETSKSDKTFLIILSVLIALGLLFGLTALSCSIACSSSGALAIIVALAGTFLIIFLLIRTIRRITKGPRQKKEVPDK